MRCALIIGSATYDDPKLARLSAPAADIRGLADVLGAPDMGGFDEVIPQLDQPKAATERAVAAFYDGRKPDDLLLLYFSGHGVLDERGRLFLAVKDTDYKLLTATAIPAGFLTDEMDRCRSRRQILILDCCHSGAFARGAKGDTRAITEATFQGSGYGRVVLTATDATQFALEGEQVIPDVRTSLFTHYLLQGLRTGEADRSPHDGKITLDEWYDYACERVVGQAPTQTPRKWSYNQQGELLIARNPHVEARQAAEQLDAPESPVARLQSASLAQSRPRKRVLSRRQAMRLLLGGGAAATVGITVWIVRNLIPPAPPTPPTASRTPPATAIPVAQAGSLQWEVSRSWEAHPKEGGVHNVCFSPDGSLIATGGYDNAVRLWDPGTGKLIREMKGHGAAIWVLTFSPDGLHLLSGSADKTARLWDVATGRLVREWKHGGDVWNASFSQNGKWTVTAAGLPDAKARVLETSSGSMLAELGENAHPVRNAFFDPTGGFVLTTSSGKDSNARIWRWSEGTFVELRRHEDQVLWAAFSPDATKVVTTSRDGTARVWDVRSGEPIRSLHHGGIVWRASFSPDGKMLAVARGNATKVWRVSTWNVEHQLENPEIFDILFCPNSRFVLALSTDDTATVLHLNTGQRTALYGHTNRLYSGDFSPNGRLIATASADGTVRLYELVTS
jgi:WD40 repeat protein/uncharacterized caspase-like protein